VNIQLAVGVGDEESYTMLLNAAKQDKWIVDAVKRLKEVQP